MSVRGSLSPVKVSKSNPVLWNEAWDKYLMAKFRPRSTYPALPSFNPKAGDIEMALAVLDEHRKELIQLQYDLAKLVAEKKDEDEFHAKWLSMGSQRRREHLLQALLNACSATPDFEERRQFCPETRMSVLEADNGKGFLSLLDTICPVGMLPSISPTPTMISNPTFDAMYHVKKEGEMDVIRRTAIYNRNLFITFFLWCTLLHVYGIEEKWGPARNGSDITVLRKKFKGKSTESRAAEDLRREILSTYRTAQYVCSSCRIPRESLPEGRSISFCVKCKDIGRKVPYCSRACQVQDWKFGSPPHKVVCGKPLPESTEDRRQSSLASSIAPASQQREFPELAPTLKQSKALAKQLSFLRRDSRVDYVLMQPYPHPDQGICMPNPVIQALFRTVFEEAVETGNADAVGCMARMLLPATKLSITGNGANLLLNQLHEEFMLSIDTIERLSTERDRADD